MSDRIRIGEERVPIFYDARYSASMDDTVKLRCICIIAKERDANDKEVASCDYDNAQKPFAVLF